MDWNKGVGRKIKENLLLIKRFKYLARGNPKKAFETIKRNKW